MDKCILCQKPATCSDFNFDYKEYKCEGEHNYLVDDFSKNLLNDTSNAFAGARDDITKHLKQIEAGYILAIRAATSEEKKENQSLTLLAEPHIYRK
jgi:hypothetical protein